METTPSNPPSGDEASCSQPPLKLTVATVTYNAAPLIARTIASVERQNHPSVEHLIIDGNSSDETLAEVHHYQERNSRAGVPHEVNCLSEPDSGLYDAMNKALQMATGDYIVFLNAGDTFHTDDTLARIAELARRSSVAPAVVYGDTHLVDADGNYLRRRRLSPPEVLTWRSFRHGMLVCHQSFFVRTDLARRFPYDLRYRFSADFDWCIRLLREAAREALPVVNSRLVIADFLHEGMTTRHHKASLKERFRIMTRHYGWATTMLQHAWFLPRSILLK